MPGVLKLEGTNIATGDGNGAVTLSNNINFPAGHVIKSGLLLYHVNSSTSISTSSTSFVDTGLEATLTTLKSSSDSRLEFYLFVGGQQYQVGNSGHVTLTLNTASNSSYDVANDLLSTPTTRNNNGEYGSTSTLNQSKMYCYHYNSSQSSPNAYPTNLSSYSAGNTLHTRVFIKKAGSNSFFFYSSDAHLTLHYYEIEK